MVNCNHTKVGITVKSFASRENEYMDTFGGEVRFIPIAEIPADKLDIIERLILAKVGSRYRTVGNDREWFDTSDRSAIVELVHEVLQAT